MNTASLLADGYSAKLAKFSRKALLEGNLERAVTERATALEIVNRYPCPLMEWKVFPAARKAALRDLNGTPRPLSC